MAQVKLNASQMMSGSMLDPGLRKVPANLDNSQSMAGNKDISQFGRSASNFNLLKRAQSIDLQRAAQGEMLGMQ